MKTIITLTIGFALGCLFTFHYATSSARAQIQATAQTDISHKTVQLRQKTAEVIAPTTK